MRGVILIIIFVFGSVLSAQITVKSTDLPNSGDTFRYSTTSNLTINTTSTGANENWDFTSLSANAQGVDEYKSFLSTPYLFYSQFWGAIGIKTGDTIGFGLLTITNVHTFFRKRSSSYTAEGTGFTTTGIPLASDYSNADRVYKLPLQYNEHDTDYFRVATTIPSLGTFIQQGVRYAHVDGWGKISTPYKDDVNCLRIKSDVLETDSLKTQFISFGFPVNRREIKWLSNTEKQPILEITGPLLGSNFTPATIKYRDSFRSTNNGGGFNPTANFSVDKTVGEKNKDTFTFTNESTPPQGLDYKWSFTPFKAKYVSGSKDTDKDIKVVFLDTGLFSVKLISSLGPRTDDTFSSNLIHISQTSSIAKLSKVKVLLLPNPVLDYVSIQPIDKSEKLGLDIYSLKGDLVMTKEIVGNTKLKITQLPKGRYILLVKGKNETTKLLFDKY